MAFYISKLFSAPLWSHPFLSASVVIIILNFVYLITLLFLIFFFWKFYYHWIIHYWLLCFLNLCTYLFIYHIEYIGQYFAPEIHLCSFFHSSDSFIPPALRYKSMAMQLNILLLMSIWVVSSLSLHSSRNGYGDCCISAVVLISLAVAWTLWGKKNKKKKTTWYFMTPFLLYFFTLMHITTILCISVIYLI